MNSKSVVIGPRLIQPTHGRKAGGGLRLGSAEKDDRTALTLRQFLCEYPIPQMILVRNIYHATPKKVKQISRV